MVTISWEGPLTDPVGYAVVAREFLLALNKIGTTCYLPYGIQGWTRLKNLDKDFVELFRNLKRKLPRNTPNITVHFRLPSQERYDKHHVVMTLFETTRIPKQWARYCNKGFRETWVPNDFNMKTFLDSGVNRLHKVHYGVNIDRYNLKVQELELHDNFKFFSTFDFSFRKNPHGLLNAFLKEFSWDEDVILYVKMWNIPSNQFKDYLGKIKKGITNKNKFPKIALIPNIVTDNRMAQVYKTIDCLVMPSYGEGWSMPCIQAMSCGTPVIATNWGGQLEFMNVNNSYLISVEEMVQSIIQPNLLYGNYMKWAKPSENHLQFLMRYVFEHQPEARKTGLRGHRDVQAFDWENAAKEMTKRAEELL